LIIEDSYSDRYLIENRLSPVAKKAGLAMVNVTTLRDAIPMLFQARLIVLDIGLEDSREPETSRLFCSIVSPPVIIFTGSEDLKSLMGLRVISKNQENPFDALAEKVMELLSEDT
jgi:hypothetical protein